MANVIDLFVRVQNLPQASQGLRSLSDDLVKSKQAQKRLSLENQQAALKERQQVQSLKVEEAQRRVILRGSRSDIVQSIQAQNQYSQILRSQANLKARLANFDKEVGQTGSTGWESLRKLLQGNLLPLVSNRLPAGLNRLGSSALEANKSISTLGGGIKTGLGGSGLTAVSALTVGIGVGVVGAAMAASSAIGYLAEKLMNTETELARIQERTKFQSIFNLDRQGGFDVQQQNEKLVKQMTPTSLSKETVLTLQTAFVDDLKAKNPTLGTDEILKRSIGIAQGFTAIQQASGQDKSQLRKNIDDIVSGTRSANQIDNLEFFTNLSPSQKKTFKEVYAKKGGLAAMEAVSQMGETLLLIEEGADSTFARLNKLQESLFGDRYGLFSVDRDLNLNTSQVESVRSEFNKTLDLLFGDQGTFSELTKIFGGSGDVMLDLQNTLKGFNTLLKALNDTLKLFSNINTGVTNFTNSGFGAAATELGKSSIAPLNPGIVFSDMFKGINLGNFSMELSKAIFAPLNPSIIITDLLKGIGSIFSTKTTANYQGLIQSPITRFKPAYAGFSSALSVESRNKPPGAKVGLLYNTGEDILPPGKLTAMLQSAYLGGKSESPKVISATVSEGAVVIYAQSGQDPETIAEYTIDRLMQKIRTELAV